MAILSTFPAVQNANRPENSLISVPLPWPISNAHRSPSSSFWGCWILKTKASWPNCPVGVEGAFGMETHNSSNLFFLKTHLTVQIAAKVSGYNAQYLRRLLHDERINGDKIGQIWLIRNASFEEYLEQVMHANDRRFGPKSAFYPPLLEWPWRVCEEKLLLGIDFRSLADHPDKTQIPALICQQIR